MNGHSSAAEVTPVLIRTCNSHPPYPSLQGIVSLRELQDCISTASSAFVQVFIPNPVILLLELHPFFSGYFSRPVWILLLRRKTLVFLSARLCNLVSPSVQRICSPASTRKASCRGQLKVCSWLSRTTSTCCTGSIFKGFTYSVPQDNDKNLITAWMYNVIPSIFTMLLTQLSKEIRLVWYS